MTRWNWKKYRVVERPEIYYDRETDTDEKPSSAPAPRQRCAAAT